MCKKSEFKNIWPWNWLHVLGHAVDISIPPENVTLVLKQYCLREGQFEYASKTLTSWYSLLKNKS